MNNYFKATIAGIIILTTILWFIKPEWMLFSVLFGSLALYFIVRIPDYRSNKKPDEFFLYNREMPKDEFVSSFVTSNIGLFSSITFSTILAYYYGIAGMVLNVGAWFLGMFLFSRAIPKLLPFLKTGFTLHEFIAEKYGTNESDKSSIRVWTSIISATLYFASIGIEVKIGADFFAPTFGISESMYLAVLIAAVGIGYTYLSGYKGVVITDRIQFWVMGLMSIAVVIFSSWHIYESIQISSFKIPSDYFSFPSILISPDPYGLFVLILLLILYQFCIMDMWQRCIAIIQTKDEKGEVYSDVEITKILQERTFKKAIFPFLWFFLVWFLIGFAALTTGITNDYNSIIPAFLNLFESYGRVGILLKAFIFTGFAAAVLSTIDTFLIATVQTIMYDIYGVKIAPGLSNKISTLSENQQFRFVHISRSFILVVGILSVLFAFLNADLLSFWTSMYSIMLPFFAVVWFAIEGKNNLIKYRTAKYSILIGFFGAALLGLIGTFVLPNLYIVYSATIFAVFVPFLILKIGSLWKR